MDNLNPFLYFLYFLLASQIIDVFHRLVWIVFSLYLFLHDLSSPVKFRKNVHSTPAEEAKEAEREAENN